MKYYLPLLLALLFLAGQASAQDADRTSREEIKTPPKTVCWNCGKGIIWATVSAGFINGYKAEYTVPAGFEKGKTSGFAPIYARVEYGLSSKVTLAFATSWSTIYFNSFKTDMGYSGPIKRYYPNKWRLFSGGLIAYYHFNHLIADSKIAPKLDLFAGGGVHLNNITESARPQGDSIIVKTSHTATPTLKVGARYNFAGGAYVYGDVGYDKLSIFSIGVSYNIIPKRPGKDNLKK